MEAVTFPKCGRAMRTIASGQGFKGPIAVSTHFCAFAFQGTHRVSSCRVRGKVATRAVDGVSDTEEPLSEESASILKDVQDVLDV